MKMIHVEKQVIKIQSHFRRVLTIKKIEKEIHLDKQDLLRKRQRQAHQTGEELALHELKQRLAKKGLTPESFFRTCDDKYKKSIPVDKFKQMLGNFKLQMSKG